MMEGAHASGPRSGARAVTENRADIALAHDGATARSDGDTFETGVPTSIGGIYNGEHRQPGTA